MNIRNHDQVRALSPADQIRWRNQVRTEIAISLAQNFTVAEISQVQENAMGVIRAGYQLDALREFEERASESTINGLIYAMAEHLHRNFLPTELVYMDGYYLDVFEEAQTFLGLFEGDKG